MQCLSDLWSPLAPEWGEIGDGCCGFGQLDLAHLWKKLWNGSLLSEFWWKFIKLVNKLKLVVGRPLWPFILRVNAWVIFIKLIFFRCDPSGIYLEIPVRHRKYYNINLFTETTQILLKLVPKEGAFIVPHARLRTRCGLLFKFRQQCIELSAIKSTTYVLRVFNVQSAWL